MSTEVFKAEHWLVKGDSPAEVEKEIRSCGLNFDAIWTEKTGVTDQWNLP